MTMIVYGVKSKKALKEMLNSESNAIGDVMIADPALMPEWRPYGTEFLASSLPVGAKVLCTNHPKRSWFAQIERTATGFKVS